MGQKTTQQINQLRARQKKKGEIIQNVWNPKPSPYVSYKISLKYFEINFMRSFSFCAFWRAFVDK